MAVQIELQPDDLLVLTYQTLDTEALRFIETESVHLTEHIDHTVFRIHDVRELKVGFSDLVILLFDAARAARDRPGGIGDPKFSEIVVVKPGTLVAFGVKSMSQRQYGEFDLRVFENLEDAQAYTQENQP